MIVPQVEDNYLSYRWKIVVLKVEDVALKVEDGFLQVEDGCPKGWRWLVYIKDIVVLKVGDGCPTLVIWLS